MRKWLFLILPAFLLAGCSTLPPWSPVPTGQSVVYGQIQDSRRGLTFIAFADNPGIIAIAVQNLFGNAAPRYAMIADEPARASIRAAVAKFDEWRKLAMDNQVEITREITTVDLAQMFPQGSEWDAGGTRQVTFVFSARREGRDALRITLLLKTSAIFSVSDQIVLNPDQAADLGRYVDKEEVDAGYADARKKQSALDKFK
ncbi:MAG TPA: hypothetical protein VFB30_13200 [Spirochaetia bacterium]|nr:hypothetical protein [Spirochaetia bacterium]